MALKRYVMVVEWYEYINCTSTKFEHKVNYTCTAGSVDEAMGKARSAYDGEGRYGLVVTGIYSE